MNPNAAPRFFDLNIEEVLDHWEPKHAVREVIANALDEQVLSGTSDIEIFATDGSWHVRDFGRGLAIEHFTLNESDEKALGPSEVIGKFGVGLKDALATFYRNGIHVTVVSRHGTFTLHVAHKHGYADITTLHVAHGSGDLEQTGTEFVLSGIDQAEVEAAKEMFLQFSGEEVLDRTAFGEILALKAGPGRIYLKGVLANEEPNFLFSYNITDLTPAMRKRLNRERTHVGRTTYADRVKAILRAAESDEVREALAEQVARRSKGDQADELHWAEISQWAFNLLHQRQDVAFVTESEIAELPNILDLMRGDGLKVVVVSDAQKEKLDGQVEAGDTDLRTVEGYVRQYNRSFEYRFVAESHLSVSEREVFDQTSKIMNLLGPGGFRPPVLISETMRAGPDSTLGVWDPADRRIVIKRSQLVSLPSYAGTLLHEVAHARTGAVDATRDFESVLTDFLGDAAAQAINRSASDKRNRACRPDPR